MARDLSRYPFRLLEMLLVLGCASTAAVAGVFVFGHMDETVAASGVVDFAELAPVSAQVEGQITAVHVREGQRVRAGELLIELDSDILAVRRDRLQREIGVLERRAE